MNWQRICLGFCTTVLYSSGVALKYKEKFVKSGGGGGGASKMAEHIKAHAAKPDLSSIPRTDMVEGEPTPTSYPLISTCTVLCVTLPPSK